MKKVILPIVFSLSFLSCKNDSSEENLIKENYISNRAILRYSAVGSMNVDILCPKVLKGNKDWSSKNVTFRQNSPIYLISNVKCSITINTYTTANGVTLTPDNAPAVLSLNSSGSGSFDHVYYHDGSGNHEYLSASALNYEIYVYENSSFPVKEIDGLFVDANANLKNISVPLHSSFVIPFKFSSFANLTINSLTVKTDGLNTTIGAGVNDWTVSNINNCTNFTSNCSLSLKYSPTKEVKEFDDDSELNIEYKVAGSADIISTSVPIRFKTK